MKHSKAKQQVKQQKSGANLLEKSSKTSANIPAKQPVKQQKLGANVSEKTQPPNSNPSTTSKMKKLLEVSDHDDSSSEINGGVYTQTLKTMKATQRK
jgi:hypothetical protein